MSPPHEVLRGPVPAPGPIIKTEDSIMPFQTEVRPSSSTIMLTALRLLGHRDADKHAVGARLLADLARVEPTSPELRDPAARAEFDRRVVVDLRRLLVAGLIRRAGDGLLALTDRGRAALSDCPDGIDDTVLMRYPEFRAHLARRRGMVIDPAAGLDGSLDVPPDAVVAPGSAAQPVVERELQEGFIAFLDGLTAADNPYDRDTHAHETWDEGYWEAAGIARNEVA
ncbi:hypothetical protein WG926_09775 [Tistrella sp. BH-R2-4]|uniref:Uncharacterized protein n=1 Tax=Tistrella arctica TaxID=3133430 RepID=A0ABU9YII2_9PROT